MSAANGTSLVKQSSSGEFLSADDIATLRKNYCKDLNDGEVELFVKVAKEVRLSPLARQIHAVKRGGSMTIQTGIDGYRIIAERTGNYTPGPKTVFVENNGKLVSAIATVKKFVHGEWHNIEAEAFYDEYVGLKQDGRPNIMWATKPRIMLAKCAEALALRKAFPAEMYGVYTDEEMEQADNPASYSSPQRRPPVRAEVPVPQAEVIDAVHEESVPEKYSREMDEAQTEEQLQGVGVRIKNDPEAQPHRKFLATKYSSRHAQITKGAA